MLQQTQAHRVIDPYNDFLAEFESPLALATSEQAAVVRAWSGLGYNRRAIHLHRCANQLVERHLGKVPDQLDALLALSGIGPYSARAILVFAFERRVGVVDTNVARILSRAVAGRSLSAREVQDLADEIVDPDDPWTYTQSLLDIGAAHCNSRPRCEGCVLGAICKWRDVGLEPPDPAVGSAKVSKVQSRFAGSDREGRGAILAALRVSPIARGDLGSVTRWHGDQARIDRVVHALVEEGFACWEGEFLILA